MTLEKMMVLMSSLNFVIWYQYCSIQYLLMSLLSKKSHDLSFPNNLVYFQSFDIPFSMFLVILLLVHVAYYFMSLQVCTHCIDFDIRELEHSWNSIHLTFNILSFLHSVLFFLVSNAIWVSFCLPMSYLFQSFLDILNVGRLLSPTSFSLMNPIILHYYDIFHFHQIADQVFFIFKKINHEINNTSSSLLLILICTVFLPILPFPLRVRTHDLCDSLYYLLFCNGSYLNWHVGTCILLLDSMVWVYCSGAWLIVSYKWKEVWEESHDNWFHVILVFSLELMQIILFFLSWWL